MRVPVAAFLCLLIATSVLAQDVVWDFEGEATGWVPRAATVGVTRAVGQGATDDSSACLRINGPIETGWNYANSDRHPMQAGKLYRLSAWVRVDSVGEGTVMPFLKCEFVAEDPNEALGRASTDTYEAARMGQWQQLQGEFMAPEGIAECWVALEKGGSAPMEIDAYLDDVKLEEIDVLAIFEKYRLSPTPSELSAVKGVHPRLYLTPGGVSELRLAIKGTHSSLWDEVRARADSAVRGGPPKYIEDDAWSHNEQLWQREVGNTMPYLALAYVLTEDSKYLDSATDWALASCGYKTWGLGSIDGMDLATGHQLFGLAIIYDWCYDDLDEDARKTIRETLTLRGQTMFEAAASGRAWWRRSYMQNHLWVDACGLSAAGFALFDEVDEASMWIGFGLEKFQRSVDALGDDGASHEGVGYWQYGAEYLLKFMYLARDLLGVDMFDHPWWRNTADYWLYMSLPRNAWNSRSVLVDIADCPRGNWYGPDHILHAMAREYQDPYAQWSAQQVDEANVDAASARWLNLVWYDPDLAPKPPEDRPTLRHFTDMGLVSARSDWTGGESLVVFKCGPHIGHKATDEFDYDPGGGHVHPDANHFLIFAGGEWLIRDDGYRQKFTGQHNTLLVDGKGQLGEGNMWFDGGPLMALKPHPRVTKAVSSETMDHIVGDAAPIYPSELGLTRYVRHLVFLKPDILIVIDDIETKNEAGLELRFHPEVAQATEHDGTYICQGKKMVLRVSPLTTEGAQASVETIAGANREGGEEFAMFTVRLQKHGATWRNAVAFSWCEAGADPVPVSLTQRGDDWVFNAADRQLLFKWDTREAVAD